MTRPLVEAWAVRHESFLVGLHYDSGDAYRSAEKSGPGQVTPLMAADRLVDSDLINSLTDAIYGPGSDDRDVVEAVLDALRHHLVDG